MTEQMSPAADTRFRGSAPEAPCGICGRLTTSQYGICQRTPACRAAWGSESKWGEIRTAQIPVRCQICGQPTRSKTGICRRTPVCDAARGSLLRRGVLRTPRIPVSCSVCGKPTRSKIGICDLTPACHAAYNNVLYQERPDRGISVTRAWQLRNPEKALLNHARSRARRRDLPFRLSITDIVIPEFCPVLKFGLEPGTARYAAPNSPTIDRLVPDQGYVPGNIWVISHLANTMKSNATPEELRRFSQFFLNFGLES